MVLTRYLLQLSWYLLTPVFLLCIPQALYVKRTAVRLPEAKGQKTENFGSHGKHLTFLHFGESTVAGVGVKTFKQGFSAQLCQTLSVGISQSSPQRVKCSITGQNGIRFQALNDLIAQQNETADFAIITMGVNDTTGLTAVKYWQEEIYRSIELLNKKGITQIFFTQVPPMVQFPALPAPLKYFLGLRAHILNTELRRICKQTHDCTYVGSKLLVEKEMMAEDGYHPSEKGYHAWAEQITPQILRHLRRKID